jgi:squalene synthase HpnC
MELSFPHPVAVDHYENFPVASVLLPARLRRPVGLIYRFARESDDFADEGNLPDAERLALLATFSRELERIERNEPPGIPWFADLAAIIREHSLPIQLFHDLLSDFAQDVTTKRYADYAGVLDYCSRSANPVGRLLLYLYDAASEQNLQYSDAICTSLQLINFWQDVAIDWDKSRIYLPQEDLHRFGVSEEQIAAQRVNDHWRALMAFEVKRARAMMLSGAPLALHIRGRLGWELRLIVQGGLRILEKIEAVGYDVFRARPTLKKRDWLLILWRALRFTN